MAHSLYAIGRVAKAFGIRGEIILEPLVSPHDRLMDLRDVFLGRSEEEAARHSIVEMTGGKSGMRVSLQGIESRDEAELLVGSFMFVDQANRHTPSADGYYVEDLIGMAVVDESNHPLGSLKDVLKMPAQDVYVIDAEGQEVMIPAVKEFVRGIDLDAKVITVRLIDGLLER